MLLEYSTCVILLVASQTFAADLRNLKTYSALSPSQPLALTLLRDETGECNMVSLASTQNHRLLTDLDAVVVVSQPLIIEATGVNSNLNTPEKLQVIGHLSANLWDKAKTLCSGLEVLEPRDQESQHVLSSSHYTELDIHPLEVSGPSSNRVDLTFFSDGYTLDEKDKFLADAKRLAQDMSQNQTFATVRPLMNFWAAFVPSRESGIGVGGIPKDTAFGLYRDGTELRAVYCSKKEVARAACRSLHTQCDYPILLANDPLYGGLGGEFTISTTSLVNGALVLRHELGHSIIGVGEEYDGGFAYFGVNAAQNISVDKSFPWSSWLSPSSLASGGFPRQERSIMGLQVYPWTMLNKMSPWSATFESSGLYSRYLVRFSLSGLPKQTDLIVRLDGNDLKWRPRPDIKLDRWHYDIYHEAALAAGSHELSFTLGESANEGSAQLCSAEIIEYGDESEFNTTVGYYGAFPTFSYKNITTFRPTNEQCLMRIVTSPNFCSICLEGLWMSLLKRVSLVDMLSVTIDTDQPATAVIALTLIQFSQERGKIREFYTITWKKDGIELPRFANSTNVTLGGAVQGTWRAEVQLHTPEVRADPHGLMTQWVQVKFNCNMDPVLVRGV